MKITSILFLAFVATAAATPTPDASPDATPNTLVKRTSCTRVRKSRRDQRGTCVDTNKANPCPGGALYTGLCPTLPNSVSAASSSELERAFTSLQISGFPLLLRDPDLVQGAPRD